MIKYIAKVNVTSFLFTFLRAATRSFKIPGTHIAFLWGSTVLKGQVLCRARRDVQYMRISSQPQSSKLAVALPLVHSLKLIRATCLGQENCVGRRED